jgi:hypothetical protein
MEKSDEPGVLLLWHSRHPEAPPSQVFSREMFNNSLAGHNNQHIPATYGKQRSCRAAEHSRILDAWNCQKCIARCTSSALIIIIIRKSELK